MKTRSIHFVLITILGSCGVLQPEKEKRAALSPEVHYPSGTIRESAGSDWFNHAPQDLEKDEKTPIEGASVAKALLGVAGLTPSKDPVIVAVVDSGIDITHEDLQGRIWVNEDEIPGNGIDDDNNGYIDDIHGWNFVVDREGRPIEGETLEVTRELVRLEAKGNLTDAEQSYYEEVKAEYSELNDEVEKNLGELRPRREALVSAVKELEKAGHPPESLSREKLSELAGEASMEAAASETLKQLDYLRDERKRDYDHAGEALSYIEGATAYYEQFEKYYLNKELNQRGDDVNDFTHLRAGTPDLAKHMYGSPDVNVGDTSHGTHVAGIIGAIRGNTGTDGKAVGIDGIATNVRIMSLRAVPDGDERDKDVANAIRYAADNGARIINMSFGKTRASNHEGVIEAMGYAAERGVLLVHSAGNDSKDLDRKRAYPSRTGRVESKLLSSWLEIGASTPDRAKLAASFSNYGNSGVDLFAPGYRIRSTIPGNQYAAYSGTSMASPVVTGVAARLLSYFPELKAPLLKQILMASTRRYQGLSVPRPGGSDSLGFDTMSVSGGVVDLDRAIRLRLGRS